MSALQNEINRLNSLKESFHELSSKVLDTQAVLTELNNGKQEMVDALATKNVQSSTTKTLSAIASDIRSIAQSPITIDGGEMYAKHLYGSITEPNYWNLYDVLTQLLNDGRLTTYGGILLAEYDKVGDSISLDGAGAGGAYVVSDKNIGNFIMYTEDTIHTWSTEYNGKANRWVAYCFGSENHNFSLKGNERSIFIGRKVGVVETNKDCEISRIVVLDGSSLLHYKTNGYLSQFGDSVIIKTLKKQESPIRLNDAVKDVYIEADTIDFKYGNDTSIVDTNPSSTIRNTILKSIIIKAKSIGVLPILISHHEYIQYLSYVCIDCEECEKIGFFSYNGDTLLYYSDLYLRNLSRIDILNCESMNFHTYFAGGEKGLCFQKLKDIYISYKEGINDKTRAISFTYNHLNNWHIVENVELKDGWCKPLDIHLLTGLTEENMINHILKRLKQDEEMCGSGVTITLGATNLAKLTSEEAVALLDSLTNTYGYTFA